jgi:hypothetical protein
MTARLIKHFANGITLGAVIANTAIADAGNISDKTVKSKATEIERTTKAMSKYVGMWVTLDGHIRHELLPDGRYDEARGTKNSAYRGRYEIRGNHIDYWDDTGFTADGTFVSDDELHHAGMILRRER